jgi:F1F0 ATPase subunit 2
MTMSSAIALAGAGGAGILLGALFFGGLWWTVQMGFASSRPAIWFLGSFVLRTVVMVTGFYWVSGGAWDRALICLIGFVLARVLLIRRLGPGIESARRPAAEVEIAP